MRGGSLMFDLTGDESSSDKEAAANELKSNAAASEPDFGWETVLLVDEREPQVITDKLTAASLLCEKRRLSAFDYLWVARRRRRSSDHQQDRVQIEANDDDDELVVLGFGVERKRIADLANCLYCKANQETPGVSRYVSQKLKMDNSRMPNKYYIVEGNLNAGVRARGFMQQETKQNLQRITKGLKDSKEYTVFESKNIQQTIDCLLSIHRRVVLAQVAAAASTPRPCWSPSGVNCISLGELNTRAAWAIQVCQAQRSLPKGMFAEKRLGLFLNEFPDATKFETEFMSNPDGVVGRLELLRTSTGGYIKPGTAILLCKNLVKENLWNVVASSIPTAGNSSRVVVRLPKQCNRATVQRKRGAPEDGVAARIMPAAKKDRRVHKPRLPDKPPKKQKRVKFSKEETEAIRKGVEAFGPGKWKDIQKSHPCLANRTNVQVKDRYRSMQEQGLI